VRHRTDSKRWAAAFSVTTAKDLQGRGLANGRAGFKVYGKVRPPTVLGALLHTKCETWRSEVTTTTLRRPLNMMDETLLLAPIRVLLRL